MYTFVYIENLFRYHFVPSLARLRFLPLLGHLWEEVGEKGNMWEI